MANKITYAVVALSILVTGCAPSTGSWASEEAYIQDVQATLSEIRQMQAWLSETGVTDTLTAYNAWVIWDQNAKDLSTTYTHFSDRRPPERLEPVQVSLLEGMRLYAQSLALQMEGFEEWDSNQIGSQDRANAKFVEAKTFREQANSLFRQTGRELGQFT